VVYIKRAGKKIKDNFNMQFFWLWVYVYLRWGMEMDGSQVENFHVSEMGGFKKGSEF